MKILYVFLFFFHITFNLNSQSCNIISKANNISPDELCSPVTASWEVKYTGVDNQGTPVKIKYDWDNGNVEIVDAVNTSPGEWVTTVSHTYTSLGNKCNYTPKATLIVNGVECTSSTQQQIVTIWDDDDHNGGIMRINPRIYPICIGDNADVVFRDITRFNCVPPQENDVPNLHTRWVQWIYGTDITMSGTPITVNNIDRAFPYSSNIITLPGPVTGSGILSDVINVSDDNYNLIGEYFEITLRNWNYCNPYDDPNIPGPPADIINGDYSPVTTTAIILIVPLPDATIIPQDTLCISNDAVILESINGGGVWTGPGVIGNKFHPEVAGVGDHKIRYSITTSHGCSDWDEITINVQPGPNVSLVSPGTLFLNEPPVLLSAEPFGGIWSGAGITDNYFIPGNAGLGTHIILYQSPEDKYGCSSFDTIHIHVILPPRPVAYFESDSIGCSPLSIQFNNYSLNGESYLWDFGDRVYSDEQNPIHIYYIPGNYIVKLTVNSISGTDSYYKVITVFRNPQVAFNVFPTEIMRDNQIIRVYNNTMYADSYLWDFGDGFTSHEFEPYHKYENSGIYNIKLYAATLEGCIDSLIFYVPIIVTFEEGFINFPNAFKWNRTGPTGGRWEDGIVDNTIFRPHFENVKVYTLLIFNRWGELIFETNDIDRGWDGYYQDRVVQQGVYIWKAHGIYNDGSRFSRVGDVTFLH